MSNTETEHRIPATGEIRHDYARAWALDEQDLDDRRHQFDRWLAEHDRQTAEKAWAEGWEEGNDITERSYAGDATASIPASRDNNPHRKDNQ